MAQTDGIVAVGKVLAGGMRQVTDYYGGRMSMAPAGLSMEMYTTPPPEPRGKHYSFVPISSADWRRKHPGVSRSAYCARRGFVEVCDDNGYWLRIEGPLKFRRELVAELQAAQVPEMK